MGGVQAGVSGKHSENDSFHVKAQQRQRVAEAPREWVSWLAGQRRRPEDCGAGEFPLQPPPPHSEPQSAQVCKPHPKRARSDHPCRHSLGRETASVTFMPISHLLQGPAGEERERTDSTGARSHPQKGGRETGGQWLQLLAWRPHR